MARRVDTDCLQKTGPWITKNDNSWSCCRYQL